MEMDDAVGENLMTYELNESVIHIAKFDDVKSGVTKFCQEKVLVHELLHCLYNYLAQPNATYEGKFLDVQQHARLEQMAKSLIMVKYGITSDWFNA